MQNFQLTHDFLTSQRGAGANDDQIASLIAKRDPKFAAELDNVKIRASQYSNGAKAIGAFLNYKVYGDATYTPEPTAPTGLLQSRGQNLRQDLANIAPNGMGPQHIPEAALNVAGEGIGLVGDAIGAGLGKITPDFIKEPLAGAAQAVMGSAPVQAVTGMYGDFKDAHPRAASNVEAAANIAGVLPVGKGAGMGLKGAKAGLGAAGDALQESGEAAIKAQKKKFVQDLIMPDLNKKGLTNEIDSFRPVQEGGLIKGRKIEPTKREIEIAEAVESIPEIDPKNTHLQNRDALNTGIERVAKDLDEAFIDSDPIISEREMRARFREARNRRESKLIFASDAQAEKMWDQLEEAYFDSLSRRPKKASSAWEARKDFYHMAENSGVDFDKMNLKTELTEILGDVANNYIEEQMKRTGHTFLPEMREMNNLYIARRNIAPKAAAEASSAIGRWVQRIQAKTKLSKSTLVALSSAGVIGGVVTGIATSLAAPALVALGTYKFGRFVFSPKVRSALGRTLKSIEEALPTIPAAQQAELRQLIKEGNEIVRGEIPPAQ